MAETVTYDERPPHCWLSMPVTDTSIPAWLRQKNTVSASSGLGKPCDLISSMVFAKVKLNPGLQSPSSPSDTSVDERKLHGERL